MTGAKIGHIKNKEHRSEKERKKVLRLRGHKHSTGKKDLVDINRGGWISQEIQAGSEKGESRTCHVYEKGTKE